MRDIYLGTIGEWLSRYEDHLEQQKEVLVNDGQEFSRKIADAEVAVMKAQQKLAELRRQAPPELFGDHELKDWTGRGIRLSDLFGESKDLIVIHNMGISCSYCTLWADGFNGVREHLENRAAFVVISPDTPEVQQELAKSRGWTFRMASAEGTDFNRAADVESAKGNPIPAVSTFCKDENGQIFRVGRAEIGPGDPFCGVWHLLDLLPDGPNGWEPKNSYG